MGPVADKRAFLHSPINKGRQLGTLKDISVANPFCHENILLGQRSLVGKRFEFAYDRKQNRFN